MDGGSIINESFSVGRILAALDTSKQAINQAYDLLRQPAKEVLVTVISDLDRQVLIQLHMLFLSIMVSVVSV